jgi:DNA-directed RNA polymerase subunit RPC12/RpoP
MAEYVLVRCAHCGREIGNITFAPGVQIVACLECSNGWGKHNKTKVTITEKAEVYTSPKK